MGENIRGGNRGNEKRVVGRGKREAETGTGKSAERRVQWARCSEWELWTQCGDTEQPAQRYVAGTAEVGTGDGQ